MRKVAFIRLAAAFAITALAACAATKEEVAQSLGSTYVGKNVDSLIVEFGPPASTFRMNSGEMAYVWQLSAVTNIRVDEGRGTANTSYCKINVIASPAGIVTRLTTEDANVGGGLYSATGVLGSICAKRLGMSRG
jgi:hypothetical protein